MRTSWPMRSPRHHVRGALCVNDSISAIRELGAVADGGDPGAAFVIFPLDTVRYSMSLRAIGQGGVDGNEQWTNAE